MKVVNHEFYTCRDGKVKEIKLIEIASLTWEAWSKFEDEGEWTCNSPHVLASNIVDIIEEDG